MTCSCMKKKTKKNKLYIAPGNAGTVRFGKCINNGSDFSAIKRLVVKIGMVVRSRRPVVNGIYDFFGIN